MIKLDRIFIYATLPIWAILAFAFFIAGIISLIFGDGWVLEVEE